MADGKKNSVYDTLNYATQSLKESITLLEGKTDEFRTLSKAADSHDKPEIGHTYNDMANMLGVMTEHAKIISFLTELEKCDHNAILDLFDLVGRLDNTSSDKSDSHVILKKIRQTLSEITYLQLDKLKLNFGITELTFKNKDSQ